MLAVFTIVIFADLKKHFSFRDKKPIPGFECLKLIVCNFLILSVLHNKYGFEFFSHYYLSNRFVIFDTKRLKADFCTFLS